MPNAKGYKSFVAWGRQTIFGTVAARTVFMRVNSETIVENSGILDSARLAPSHQVAELGGRFTDGTLSFDGNYSGIEHIFKDAFGTDTITTPGGATLSRLHTFALADDLPSPGVSLEVNKGGLQSHLYADCKIRRLRMSSRSNALMQLEADYIGRAETLVSTTTATYASLLPIVPSHLIFQVDGVTVGPLSIDISLDNQVSGEDRFEAAGRDIKEPERTAVRLVDGSFTLDYDSVTQYNKFKNFGDVALTLVWTGAIIEGALPYKLTISMPRVKFRGTTPTATTPGVLPLPIPFRAYETTAGAANEISATIQNIATTVL